MIRTSQAAMGALRSRRPSAPPRPVEIFRTEETETEGCGHGDGKFAGVDGADTFRVHFVAAEDQRAERSPSSASGINETALSQRDEQAVLCSFWVGFFPKRNRS